MTCGCGCTGGRIHLNANVSGGTSRKNFKGREHLIVPVVMLRQTVVNGAYVPKSELKPEAWNGVPVTLNHPEERGQSITANHPAVLEQWQIGTIFSAKMRGDRLIAEAWIDVELAEEMRPGLIADLESAKPMDVSTGYFPTTQKKSGNYSGKPYTEIHTELKPDHLALLPDVAGACSWDDGCGVRANSKGTKMTKPNSEEDPAKGLIAQLVAALVPNKRGEKDDRRQIVADLISQDATPFVPDDMYSLMDMSQDTLNALRDKYLPEEEPKTNHNAGGTTVSDIKKEGAALTVNKVSDMSVEDFTALIANTAKTAADEAVTEALTANKRSELVGKIVANKELGMTEDDLKSMSVPALEKLAANAEPKKVEGSKITNFGGRPLRTNADSGATEARKYPGLVGNAGAVETKKEA